MDSYKIKLSPYTKTFYTEWLINPDSSNYNIVVDQILYGNLDVARLKKALYRYIAEHVLLNSHIQNIDGEPHWIKNANIFELEYSDNPTDISTLRLYVTKGFDLHNGPTHRFKLFRLSESVYRFIIVLHHIVIDGSSMDAGLFEALSKYYNDENYNMLPNIDDQVALIKNLTETLSAKVEQNKTRCKEFWHNKLEGVESCDLRFLKSDNVNVNKYSVNNYNPIGQISFNPKEEDFAKLKQIKHKYVITPYIYSLCVFALLLNRYTNQEKLAISYVTAIKEGIDFIYGAQINTNLIAYQFNKTTTIIDLFNQSKEFFKSLRQDQINYSYCPIIDIIQENNKHLLDLYFIQPNFRKEFTFDGISKVIVCDEFNIDTADPFVFEQELKNNNPHYRVRYNKKIINEILINNFIVNYKKLFLTILNDLAHDKNELISNYALLDQKQYQQIVYEFNKTNLIYPKDQTFKELFEKNTREFPEQIAASYEKQNLTYRELNEKTNQLARFMRENGVDKAETMVGIYLNRSLNLLIGLIATIKSGGTYVPIDPNYPHERIKFILQEAKIKLVLTQEDIVRHNPYLAENNFKTICLDHDWQNVHQLDPTDLTSIHKPDHLMYVIYTSGSTGNPKGVQITHLNVANFLAAMQQFFPLSKADKFLAATAITFDIAGLEIYLPLVQSAQIVIADQETITNPKNLIQLIDKEKITYMQATPALWRLLVDAKWKGKKDLTLLSGGESLPQELAKILLTKGKALWNLYGPTETTIWSTATRIDKGNIIHIGKPIANTKIFILDPYKNPMPIGAVGELYIGGDGVGKGYLERDNLNAEKFIKNPFDNSKSTLIFKTNDLARYLPDGNIEYLGRKDYQIKLHGYRIEPGEIENKLINYPGVKQVVVLDKEYTDTHLGTDKYLIAYYIADNELDKSKLRDYLATQLPKYMLPSIFIYLDKLPLTTSGKIDRKNLPDQKFTSNNNYEAPTNKQEQMICEVFANILELDKVGINDDFFNLGGNSLKAITLVSILQSNFDIKVTDIFNLRTPKNLAANSNFSSGVLKRKLQQIKLSYQNIINETHIINQQLQGEINHYLEDIKSINVDPFSHKPIHNVLLTGATGYLGCNILHQLLVLTDYTVFLLVRASSQEEAVDRINKKFQFYFNKSLHDLYGSRIHVVKADLEESSLGLSQEEYQNLANKTDSIIHSAALVKHYGEYEKFYRANVQATINLLELAKLTKLKDFHYISTYSVLILGAIENQDDHHIYTENDLPSNPEKYNNVYLKTKLQGEQQVIKYRAHEINGSIYRAGNLAFMSENSRAQENINDNAFFNWLKCLLKIKCLTPAISIVEISPADVTAQALVRLFDKEQLRNNIYHVFNPYLFDLSSALMADEFGIHILEMHQFIDNIMSNLDKNIYRDLVVKFLLYQGWLDGLDIRSLTTSTQVLQNKTAHILKQLGFNWTPITNEIFNGYLKLLK